MANLIKRVFRPSVSYEDKIMFMTSLELNQAFSTENPAIAVGMETAIQMLTSQSNRYVGLQFLEQALRQNSEGFFCNGKWTGIIFQILKDHNAENLEKILACKILVLTIPYNMDNENFSKLKEELVEDIYPILLERIKENVEWTEEACKVVKTCLKSFPSHLNFHQNALLKVILHQATISVSSKSFEVLAECFCEIPYCTTDNNASAIKACWLELYKRTLTSLDHLRIECLSYGTHDEEPQSLELDSSEFNFENEGPTDFYVTYMNTFRRFVNLSKCLTKLLSVKPRYTVKVPVLATIRCFVHLFTVRRKEKVDESIQQLMYTLLVQMQLSSLSVLEALVLNTNTLQHVVLLKDTIFVALKSSKPEHFPQPISELRIAVWKLLHLWLESLGRGAAKEVIRTDGIIQELLIDISLETYESLQSNISVQAHKSKKNVANSRNKSILVRNTQPSICEAALRSLKSLIYCGSLDFAKPAFQEICLKIFQICHAINSDPIPFPYSNDSCRRAVYSIVLAISTVSQPGEVRTLQRAIAILSRIRNDPSFKVRKLSNKAAFISRLQLYSKRPIPFSSDYSNQKKPNVSEERCQYSEWVSDAYIQNISAESEPESSENMNANMENSFQNPSEGEIHTSEDYMEMETEYSEQVVENQCNGEGLDIPSSSQCQDEDESEEEEEEEEEDERDYGEEDMNADEPESELYIPETKKVQNVSSVQIKSESVISISEPEYEEITSHSKFEESSKDKCVNGNDITTNENISGITPQTISNENGVLGCDDDDEEEEEEDEDEDDDGDGDLEEEKEVEEEKSNRPSKRQKIEPICEPEEVKPRSPSPTEESAKAILMDMFPEDARSGKNSLSSTSS